jgi:hypothetical protein
MRFAIKTKFSDISNLENLDLSEFVKSRIIIVKSFIDHIAEDITIRRFADFILKIVSWRQMSVSWMVAFKTFSPSVPSVDPVISRDP